VFTGRSGNGGACAQPCRWEYQLSEKGYPDEYFPAYSDDRGTYVLNSKDLCMIEHLKDMIDAGIMSLKIEGRMKSAYYVACVTRAYRQALEDVYADKPFDPELLEEIGKAGSRAYTTGFFYGNPREKGQDIMRGKVERTHDFVGVIKAETDSEGWTMFEQRGKFCVGDTLEVLSPQGVSTIKLNGLRTLEGESRECAPHPKEMLELLCEEKLLPGDMLRKKR
jgi:putative protease